MTAVEWLVEQLRQLAHDPNTHIGIGDVRVTQGYLDQLEEQAKQMEKEQVKDAFVECWKANVPDGIECKLDAEQYYNETFKSE